MAWSDKATPTQIGALLNLLYWPMPPELEPKAAKYLETKTRGEVSREMNRVRDLYIDRKLTKDNMFDGEIWSDFPEFLMNEKKNSKVGNNART